MYKRQGYGCYAPCIVKALQSALDHEGAADAFEVVDETGKTAAQLCEYIDAGMPVVFWATLDFTPVPEERDHWLLADGTDFAWKCHEHCLLLVGYDDERYFRSIVNETGDRLRVRDRDIKKLYKWYNLLLADGFTKFVEDTADAATEAEKPAESKAE
mgnify:CR=1 FL=1